MCQYWIFLNFSSMLALAVHVGHPVFTTLCKDCRDANLWKSEIGRYLILDPVPPPQFFH